MKTKKTVSKKCNPATSKLINACLRLYLQYRGLMPKAK